MFFRALLSARCLLTVLMLAGVLLCARDAHAFAWTIRHAYTRCTPCHVDPAGGGILTAYGRGMADEAINTRWGSESESEEASSVSQFLFGAVELPEPLNLQADVRFLHLRQKTEQVPLITRNLLMQADFAAALQLRGFTASASLGYAHEGALSASLTSAETKNLVSRQHWLGYSLLDDKLMLRAGRYNLPFGLRSIEHTLWARTQTRTNINDQQQYGLGAVYQGDRLRAELMVILGNFQLRPDRYRERGYSATVEGYLTDRITVGASSLITHRKVDPLTLKETYRHAHGVFSRIATPWQPLVLMAELDYVLESPRFDRKRSGVVGYLQADLEPVQGIHIIGTGELQNVGNGKQPLSWAAWLSYAWFFAPHADVRVDGIYQDLSVGSGLPRLQAVSFLLQGHVYL